jgi:hypothetical protein
MPGLAFFARAERRTLFHLGSSNFDSPLPRTFFISSCSAADGPGGPVEFSRRRCVHRLISKQASGFLSLQTRHQRFRVSEKAR